MEILSLGIDGEDKLTFEVVGLLDKGRSLDRKHVVMMKDGTRGLLRTSDIIMLARKKEEFEFLMRVYGTGIRCSRPYAFGTCEEGRRCGMLLSYLEGDDAETVIPMLPV